ncbi:MAG: Ig domain-containing protein, partial [Pseudomonadota bacterium]
AIDVGGSITGYSAPLISYIAPLAAAGSWQFVFVRTMPLAPLDLSAAFSGTDLAFAVAAGSDPLPAGLALSAGGVLSGTPSGASAVVTVTVEASNPVGTAQRSAQVEITEADLFADYAAQIYAGAGGASASFAALHSFTRPGTATRHDATGAIEILTADAPRFDHSLDGEARGLLVETGATNRLLDSEASAGGWSMAAGLAAASAGLSLRGRWTGLVLTGGGNDSARLEQIITVTAGETLRFTLFCQPGSSGRLMIQFRDLGVGQNSAVRGSFGSLGPASSAAGGLQDITETTDSDGVVRVSLTYTPNFTGDLRVGIGPDTLVAGGSVVFLAAQTAQGSYIPTLAAPATRGADMPGLSTLSAPFYDLALTYDDDSSDAVVGFPTSSVWPAMARPHLKRLTAHRAGFGTLTLSTGAALLRETDAALYLETPA